MEELFMNTDIDDESHIELYNPLLPWNSGPYPGGAVGTIDFTSYSFPIYVSLALLSGTIKHHEADFYGLDLNGCNLIFIELCGNQHQVRIIMNVR